MTVESSPSPSDKRRFGPFELDLRSGELRRDGELVKLQPQPFRVLALLVSRPGELVTRDELKKALWGEETYVDFERGLNFCINQVRTALGDSADAPQFIQTLPRRGYRFIRGSDRGRAGVATGSDPGRDGVAAGSDPVTTLLRAGSDPPPSTSTGRLKVGRTAHPVAVSAIGVGFLAVLIAGAAFIARRTTPPPVHDASRTMVAVLPFEDLTGDAPPSWFADGLTDELIAQIGRVSPARLGVIARTSVMTLRGSNKSIADIGRELRVSHVLEGSLRREADRIQVNVQLVAVDRQSPMWFWSQSYDRAGTLTIQSEIAAQLTRALALELRTAPWAHARWTPTADPDARDALLQGKYFLNRATPGDLRAALTRFEDAVLRDPAFAAAYAAQVDAYHLLAMFGRMSPPDAYARAAMAAREAVRLDPDLADSHTAMGVVQLWGEWNPSAAAASFERALALNPSDAAAHHDYAWALVALDRFDEAAAHITRARDLDPLSPRASNDIGWLYLHIRQPAEAIRACRQTLALDPDSVEAQHCLERAYLQRGELTQALSAAHAAASRRGTPLPAALEEEPTPQRRIVTLWRGRLQRLESIRSAQYVSPYTMAMHHVMLGDGDEALASLEDGYRARAGVMVLLPTDPLFDRLREHPRFRQLVEKIRGQAHRLQ